MLTNVNIGTQGKETGPKGGGWWWSSHKGLTYTKKLILTAGM
jgi:hypothetical protein